MIVRKIDPKFRLRIPYGHLVSKLLDGSTSTMCTVGWFCVDYTHAWVQHWEEEK